MAVEQLTNHGEDGKFRSDYDLNARYDLVREVALVADPDFPDRITMVQFDDARATAGHPDAPSARASCMALKMKWRELLERVFDPERDPVMSAAAHRRQAARIPVEEEIFFALRFVAMKRDRETLTYDEYDLFRLELIEEDKRRMRSASFLEHVLPTAGQIWNACGKDWAFALSLAQLKSAKERKHARAADLDEVYGAFVETTGARPAGWATLDRFAQRANMPMRRRTGREKFEKVEKAILAQRKKQGLDTPDEKIDNRTASTFEIPPELAARLTQAAANRPPREWTYETVLAGLTEYVKSLKAGERATQHHYSAKRVGTPWPSVRKIQDYGAWTPMLAAARKLAQTGEITPLEDVRAATDASKRKRAA